MPLLSEYITATQELIHDQSFQTISSTDMIQFINRARERVAKEAQCVRLLVSGQGPITGVSVVNGGSNYSNPVVTITGTMGTGAVATATVTAGVITAITVTNGGSNYSPPLMITITDPTGAGASATALQAANLLTTVVGQEVYPFSAADPLVRVTPGYDKVFSVYSIAATWGGMKPVLGQKSFTEIQAYYRSYAVPTLGQAYIWAKYGQGASGSVYLWMIPSTQQAMDWDCICLPTALIDDTSVDVIPEPYSDAVPYYAARLCFLNAQRFDDAKEMKEHYMDELNLARGASDGPVIPDMYGGDSW